MSFDVFQLNQSPEKYLKLLKKIPFCTAYHTLEYLLAEEKAESESVKIFVYEDGANVAFLPSIQRNIGLIEGLEKYDGYYDLKTPHEYSGVLASSQNEKLYVAFWKSLEKFCKENKIIFHFIRFNPYLCDSSTARQCGYNVILSNQQTYVNLEKSDDVIKSYYSSSLIRNLKIASKHRLSFDCKTPSIENINLFQLLYEQSMARLSAKSFFYFNGNYFQKLLVAEDTAKLFFVSYNEHLAAASILLLDEKYSYYHLSCSDRFFSKYKPMEYLLDNLIATSKNFGKKILHLGGGATTLKDFKQRFSPLRIEYFIAYKIFDEPLYKKICLNCDADENYLPAYRGRSI